MWSTSDIVLISIQFVLLLIFIALGSFLGGIGIAYAGGLGLLVFSYGFNMSPVNVTTKASYAPWDVIEIIMSVIGLIASMQAAGGLDYLVHICEKAIRKVPKAITFVAPLVTFLMTILAGTGHTAFSTLPIIAEVAKENGIRPSKPLTIAVIASQIAICASPISAALVTLTNQGTTPEYVAATGGLTYLKILAVSIPSCFIGTACGAIVAHFWGRELKNDKEFLRRLRAGECRVRNPEKYLSPEEVKEHYHALEGSKAKKVERSASNASSRLTDGDYVYTVASGNHGDSFVDINQRTVVTINSMAHEENPTSKDQSHYKPKKGARRSVAVFGVVILFVVLWSILTSSQTNVIPNRRATGADAITFAMLTGAVFVVILSRVPVARIPAQPTFQSGAVAVLSVLGVGWMGAMYVGHWSAEVEDLSARILNGRPWVLAFITLIAGCLLYSQTVTTKVILQIAFNINMSPTSIVASFPATAGLFILPTYPTVIAAAEIDDTGSTRLGKYIFDHPFVVPGLVAVAVSVGLGYGIGAAVF